MGDHRTLAKLTAVTLSLAAFGAACGDDDSGSDGSVESWCGLMDVANEVDATFESIETFDPAGLETAMNQAAEAIPRLEAAAPPEIADDMKVLGDYTGDLISALEDADYSLFDIDLAAIADPATQASVDEANANLDAYSVENCGQAFGGDDGDEPADSGDSSDDSSFDPSAGTIREQLVSQFVSIGFTQDEAECMADGVDPTDESILSGDQEAVLALFEACDIPLSRLAELGG